MFSQGLYTYTFMFQLTPSCMRLQHQTPTPSHTHALTAPRSHTHLHHNVLRTSYTYTITHAHMHLHHHELIPEICSSHSFEFVFICINHIMHFVWFLCTMKKTKLTSDCMSVDLHTSEIQIAFLSIFHRLDSTDRIPLTWNLNMCQFSVFQSHVWILH